MVKSDRQDDGLQQARDIVTAYFDCHGINNARAAGLNIVARIMEAGLTVVPLSTRDAAEVAGRCPHCRQEFSNSGGCEKCAPPKPAPDAMREAIEAAVKANPYTNYSYVIDAMLADERVEWRNDLQKRAADRDLERRTIDLSPSPAVAAEGEK